MTRRTAGGRIRSEFLQGDAEFSATPLDSLSVAALAYVGLPVVIFLLTWLRPLASIGALIAVGLALMSVAGRFRIRWEQRPSAAALAVILATAFGWAALGGGSHYVYANPDWIVRDSVLGDLAFSEWPPSYRLHEGVHHLLRSAIGFFLPVAFGGKLFGPAALPHLMYLWTGCGVAIFLLLLPLPARRRMQLLAGLCIVILFSGMDVLGVILVHGHYPVFPLRLEWWNEFDYRAAFSYSSLTGQLIWAPNHALPMWIGTALLYRHWKHPDLPVLLCLLLPSLPLSTPFALPGLAPFIVFAIAAFRAEAGKFPAVPIYACLVGIVLLALVTRLQMLDIETIVVASTASTVPASPVGESFAYLRNYLVFVLMEFAILGLVLFRTLAHSRGMLLLALAVLFALPLVTLGPSNDLLLRVATPSLVLLAILAMSTITACRRWTGWHATMVLILLIGAHTPVNETARAMLWNAWKPDYTRSFVEIQQGHLPPHYIGRLTDPILRTLLRPPKLVPSQDQRR